ncbi:hypothetical protein ACA910_017814 [Epithemia clementina (nom. ined.)]
MIALHRFQTESKVAYCRLVGMHGGGGGNKSAGFLELLTQKMKDDIDCHYGGNFPYDSYWPNPVSNSPLPQLIGAEDKNQAFAYTFCWHGQPQFLLWHRPLMAEFEIGLQEHDPKYDEGDPNRHSGADALGAPYWGWEAWDGLTLSQVVTNFYYIVTTDAFAHKGLSKGSSFCNPYFRWIAPVSVEQQLEEHFPEILKDENATRRDSAFSDFRSVFANAWPQVSQPGNPSMKDVVQVAISNPSWNKFATSGSTTGQPENYGSIWSIENPHNKFHNHVGGRIMGGTQ